MRRIWSIVLPILIVVVAVMASRALAGLRQPPERTPVAPWMPVVQVADVTPGDQRLSVTTHGAVVPRAVATLAAEVTGQVIEVAAVAEAGAWVAAETPLFVIDPADYRAAVATATAELSDAQRALAVEQAAAARAAQEWQLVGNGEASPLTLREPQVAAAQARIAAAQASLERAERDLARTTVRAPFAGRVVSRHISLGERVGPGSALIELEAADAVEVVLPIALADLAWLELPLRGEQLAPGAGPAVTVSTTVGDHTVSWEGSIVRVRSQLAERSRMVEAVARIPQPPPGDNRPPLLTGLFVSATISGTERSGVLELPLAAIQSGDGLWGFRAQPPAWQPRLAELPSDHNNPVMRLLRAPVAASVRAAGYLADGTLHPGDGTLVALEATVLRRTQDTALVEVSVPEDVQVVMVPVAGGRDGQAARLARGSTP